jgi:hypothetical protein
MQKAIFGFPLILFVVAMGLLLVGQFAAGLAVMMVWIMAVAIASIRGTGQARAEDLTEEMDAESRSLYAPVRRLVDEIEEVVRSHRDSTVMKVIGGEALQEARRIREQVARALAVRDDLKRASRGRNVARSEADKLMARAEEAASTEEKLALLSAVEARKIEIGHYAIIDETVAKIDASVRQAQAALSEMKARLSVKATGEKAASAVEEDELRETIGRLKQLSISYDEAEQLLRP